MATFAAVVRNGSVRGAAGELRVTPSAISQQIRQLEQEMGVALFGRAGRRLTLTDAGAAFYQGCVEMIRAAERARADLAAFQHAPVGESISAPTGLSGLLAQALRPFLARSPKLSLRIIVTDDAMDLCVTASTWRFRSPGRCAIRAWCVDTWPTGPVRRTRLPQTQGHPSRSGRPRSPRFARPAARAPSGGCPDWR